MLKPGKIELTDRQFILRLLGGYLVVNLALLGFASLWNLNRAWFSLDYLLVVLVYVWVSRSLAAGLFGVCLLADFVRMLVPLFFYTSQAFSAQFWLREVLHWPTRMLVVGGLAAGLLLAAMIWFVRRYRLMRTNRRAATMVALTLAVTLVLLDWINGTSSRAIGDANLFSANLASSPAYLIAAATRETISGTPATFTPLPLEASATGRYVLGQLPAGNTNGGDMKTLLAQAQLPGKILLIVAESLSVRADDPDMLRWRRPFAAVTNRYTIEAGKLDWSGSTLRGEFRELCWTAKDGIHIGEVPDSLPKILAGMGYETVFVHGFFSGMYDRKIIHPRLGFARLIFLEEFQQQMDQPLAGTLFSGARDSYTAEVVRQTFHQPGRQFIEWLTLSAHVPIDVGYAKELATPTERAAQGEQPASVWGHTVICTRLMEHIAQIAADPAFGEGDIIIVGDHPVPLQDARSQRYYEPGKIPFLILRHRTMAEN